MEQTLTEAGSNSSQSPHLSDEQLAADYPAVAKLVGQLEDIAARDPSQGVAGIASALAEYFRTPDAA